METAIDYSSPGPLTGLQGIAPEALATLGVDPVEICSPVHALVPSVTLPVQLALDSAPLTSPREPGTRVVGTCRHFAVISCALLRHRGIPARVRCGFATYFQPGQGLDHWITEYWSAAGDRWVRVDSEIFGADVLEHPEDLGPGEFLSGGEAWQAFRREEVDASTFGVYGTDNWGAAEIRGNVVKDLAALNKVETLPWDEWGRMTAAYAGETGADYDELLDTVAATCAADDPGALAALYEHGDLAVPAEFIR